MAKTPGRPAPIQNIDVVDIVGRWKDGRVNLGIVASGHLDGSAETQQLLLDKIESYLEWLNTPEFQAEFDHPPADKVRIVVCCDERPDEAIIELLRRSKAWVEENNARLALERNKRKKPGAAKESKKTEGISTRPLSAGDRLLIAGHEATVIRLLKARYGNVQLRRDETDLKLMQRLIDDGALRPDQDHELQSLGIVLGQVFAAQTPLQWVSVDFQGDRHLALEYPGTINILFPGSMISKRVKEGREVDFVSLFRTLAAYVDEKKDDPEYKK